MISMRMGAVIDVHSAVAVALSAPTAAPAIAGSSRVILAPAARTAPAAARIASPRRYCTSNGVVVRAASW